MVEHLTFNQRAAGSIPAGLTMHASPSSSLAKDTALSRRRRGFKSPWGRHFFSAVPRRGFEPETLPTNWRKIATLGARQAATRPEGRWRTRRASPVKSPWGCPSFPVDFSREANYNSGLCDRGLGVGGPGTVVKASASGREAALNIYGDLCVEEVGKTRFFRTIRSGESCGKPGGSRRKSRRTIQEVQKRYH